VNERETKALPDPRLGEIRMNDYGPVEFICEARGFVGVWQVGTDFDPYFMPLREYERLPKVDK
jgi:hypothetical protein